MVDCLLITLDTNPASAHRLSYRLHFSMIAIPTTVKDGFFHPELHQMARQQRPYASSTLDSALGLRSEIGELGVSHCPARLIIDGLDRNTLQTSKDADAWTQCGTKNLRPNAALAFESLHFSHFFLQHSIELMGFLASSLPRSSRLTKPSEAKKRVKQFLCCGLFTFFAPDYLADVAKSLAFVRFHWFQFPHHSSKFTHLLLVSTCDL